MIYNNLKEIEKTVLEWGYESSCFIGRGSFAEVYRVKECDAGRFWACKVSRQREMLRKESLILQQLEHPLFPRFCDLRETEENVFLFMEYVPGSNVRRLIEKRGKMTQQQVIRIATALAEGLCYLHELRTPILFRDLKPENIIIREDGEVKLLDFGSADLGKSTLHIITGTEGFAAPEQWLDSVNVGNYSDVYALGKVLYFMLGNGKIENWFYNLLEDCVRDDPKERIPDMRCFLSRLQRKERERNAFVYQWSVVR